MSYALYMLDQLPYDLQTLTFLKVPSSAKDNRRIFGSHNACTRLILSSIAETCAVPEQL